MQNKLQYIQTEEEKSSIQKPVSQDNNNKRGPHFCVTPTGDISPERRRKKRNPLVAKNIKIKTHCAEHGQATTTASWLALNNPLIVWVWVGIERASRSRNQNKYTPTPVERREQRFSRRYRRIPPFCNTRVCTTTIVQLLRKLVTTSMQRGLWPVTSAKKIQLSCYTQSKNLWHSVHLLRGKELDNQLKDSGPTLEFCKVFSVFIIFWHSL